jgi:hypothetical protein
MPIRTDFTVSRIQAAQDQHMLPHGRERGESLALLIIRALCLWQPFVVILTTRH